MNSTRTQAIVEAIKEAGRIAFFAAVTALVAWASDKLAGLDPTSMTVVIGTVVLRVVDKFVHENNDIKANGIAPF